MVSSLQGANNDQIDSVALLIQWATVSSFTNLTSSNMSEMSLTQSEAGWTNEFSFSKKALFNRTVLLITIIREISEAGWTNEFSFSKNSTL